jgi:hypothetical protein
MRPEELLAAVESRIEWMRRNDPVLLRPVVILSGDGDKPYVPADVFVENMLVIRVEKLQESPPQNVQCSRCFAPTPADEEHCTFCGEWVRV